jgi:hypothetical protein
MLKEGPRKLRRKKGKEWGSVSYSARAPRVEIT